jgi:hypothetical protein
LYHIPSNMTKPYTILLCPAQVMDLSFAQSTHTAFATSPLITETILVIDQPTGPKAQENWYW